jgi:FixJ family two-component response regulator
MVPARIALVDDEASVRVALARLLRLADYEVITYASGEEFLAAIDEFRPDCVLLDVHMPGLTGIQVQQRLRSDHLNLPAVFITASEEADVERDALAAGGICLLRKPFSSHQLLACIESSLTISRATAP